MPRTPKRPHKSCNPLLQRFIPCTMRHLAAGFVAALLSTAPLLAAQNSPAQGQQPRDTAGPATTLSEQRTISPRTRSRRNTSNSNSTTSGSNTTASTRLQATEDSPLLPISTLTNSLGIPSGSPIHVRLSADIDSAHAKNGDTLTGTLSEPLHGMPAGTPVTLTVVSAAPAGRIQSFGELSIQALSVGGHPLLSNVINAQGQEGKKEVLDAAPAKGTEAVFPADQPITLPAA